MSDASSAHIADQDLVDRMNPEHARLPMRLDHARGFWMKDSEILDETLILQFNLQPFTKESYPVWFVKNHGPDITPCDSYWASIATCVLGDSKHWPWLKAQNMAYARKVLQSPIHPRHNVYRRILKSGSGRDLPIDKMLYGRYDVMDTDLMHITADLYRLQIFVLKNRNDERLSSSMCFWGSSNRRQVFLYSTPNAATGLLYRPIFIGSHWYRDEASFRLPTPSVFTEEETGRLLKDVTTLWRSSLTFDIDSKDGCLHHPLPGNLEQHHNFVLWEFLPAPMPPIPTAQDIKVVLQRATAHDNGFRNNLFPPDTVAIVAEVETAVHGGYAKHHVEPERATNAEDQDALVSQAPCFMPINVATSIRDVNTKKISFPTDNQVQDEAQAEEQKIPDAWEPRPSKRQKTQPGKTQHQVQGSNEEPLSARTRLRNRLGTAIDTSTHKATAMGSSTGAPITRPTWNRPGSPGKNSKRVPASTTTTIIKDKQAPPAVTAIQQHADNGVIAQSPENRTWQSKGQTDATWIDRLGPSSIVTRAQGKRSAT